MSAAYWEHPDFKTAKNRRVDAYAALCRAALQTPRPGTSSYVEHIASMEPLRVELRDAINDLSAVINRLEATA